MKEGRELEEIRGVLKKKTIGVLMGGLSSEREVSLRSGRCVESALRELGYKVVSIDVGRDVGKRLRDENIDAAFIALHGRYGEDGAIQGLLELMGIAYTGSGVMASAISMDKAATKTFLLSNGIPTPDFIVLKHGASRLPDIPFPLIVKPAREGSTIGVSLVNNAIEYSLALKEAYRYDTKILVERFIEGRELTVAILEDTVFPAVEIMPLNEPIFGFNAKYKRGMTDFKAPAIINKKSETGVRRAAVSSYECLGCRGAARVDIILSSNDKPHVLEVNTIPGMTDTSLFPMAAATVGVGYAALVERMLFEARLDNQ